MGDAKAKVGKEDITRNHRNIKYNMNEFQNQEVAKRYRENLKVS